MLKTLQLQHGHRQTEEERREAEERHSVLETDLSQIKDRKESTQVNAALAVLSKMYMIYNFTSVPIVLFSNGEKCSLVVESKW